MGVRTILYFLLTATGTWVFAQGRSDSATRFAASDSVRISPATRTVSLPDSLVSFGLTFLGDNYKRGGTGAKGFDCSGYTMRVFRHLGIRLPHTSAGQGLVGVEVPRSQVRKGDLILFKGRSRRSRRIGHVGIVISQKGEPVSFIHSSNTDGVRIDRLDFDYYRKRFVKVVRIPELYR
jgi:cell wall-associated NlpC family hydrolase